MYCFGVNLMAEYYISYEEMNEFVDDILKNIPDESLLHEYKAELLAAITGYYGGENKSTSSEMIALWQNSITEKSELLIRNRYIRVQKFMLEFLTLVCTSGIIDAIISSVLVGSITGFNISIGSSITIFIWEFLSSVKKLEDWDFCIYLQAVKHYKKHKSFTKTELCEWLPNNSFCNIEKKDIWNCKYLQENGLCDMHINGKVDVALNSLIEKGLLRKTYDGDEYSFTFEK